MTEESYSITRKHPRYQIKAKILRKGDQNEQYLESRDLSEGGMGLDMINPPFVGEVLFLLITLGDSGENIDTKAEVVWRREGVGCGVRFYPLTAKEREALKRFLQAQSE